MISFIFAMDQNRAIGYQNDLPWHLPNDLAFFKRVTTGHTIVMGRKTYESIGRPLPKRRNIIITRNDAFVAQGCEVVHTKEELQRLTAQEDEVFVIGGTEIFTLFWDAVDRLYVTYIDDTFKADTYFPNIDPKEWHLKSTEKGTVDEKNKHPHEFRIYERIRH
ncbi:dihydrofolate reductase [Halalkalibacter hemicellulosilyticus]|uniref:Dihydrofolate reductase n=1 Tax=Halalkalibacter hemicellulosilyticusJCM 9152 TaxID=1236971 RepID=W4QEB7_9BACI|nr:dihydrofolate reductase [Halalkalibacter hemicellulosilyticus]GAE30292.1 dihydrofolate reductase [Halalkalibacter hemicellulosilyticusJCM 9152]